MSDLFDKVYGCIAGAFVGSAMGAAVEGWEWRDIQAESAVWSLRLGVCCSYGNLLFSFL